MWKGRRGRVVALAPQVRHLLLHQSVVGQILEQLRVDFLFLQQGSLLTVVHRATEFSMLASIDEAAHSLLVYELIFESLLMRHALAVCCIAIDEGGGQVARVRLLVDTCDALNVVGLAHSAEIKLLRG